MKISIVMSYYNRRHQLLNTLRSIVASTIKDIEIIIVDDASQEGERLEDLVVEYPFLRLIRVEKKDKWWINPCIPYNIGISCAKGEIIVLQNPECLHVGDVLQYIIKHINDKNFLSISTYALPNMNDEELFQKIKTFHQLPQQCFVRGVGWYNHPKYRPVYFHFCAALTRKNMLKLGGFDERYSMGVARDDVEFVDRVGRLGLKKEIITEVSVIHQWHSKAEQLNEIRYKQRLDRNCTLYDLLTQKENSIYKENSYSQARPKVTVIIPYRVNRGWLNEAILSVPPWVELLVNQGEAGWAENFNQALSRATGDYIRFLHEDDTLPVGSILNSVRAIEEQGVDFIHGNAVDINEKSKIITHWKALKKEITYEDMLHINLLHGGTVMYRKSIFDKLGGFNTHLNHAEEYEFNLRCFRAGFRLGFCDEELYCYRRHSKQKSNQYEGNLNDYGKWVVEQHLKHKYA